MFRTPFVMDIYNGAVVHAVRGERSTYKPVHTFSRVCPSSVPAEVVRTVRPREVYIADLDRIQKRGDNLSMIRGLHPHMMLDMGVASIEDVRLGLSVAKVVLGSETAPLGLIEEACERYGKRIAVSIDCRDGGLLSPEPLDVLEFATILGQYEVDVLLLSLSRVGTASGIDTPLLSRVMDALGRGVLYGGGVASLEHIDLLKEMGASGALIATAVHSGAIPLSVVR